MQICCGGIDNIDCPKCKGSGTVPTSVKCYDIVLRFCGGVGWLGIVKMENEDHERYRTGAHHKTREMALQRCDEWVSKNLI